MPHLTIRKAADLSGAAKTVIESILGRTLRDDEEVGIWASRSYEAQAGQARQNAWRELNGHLDLMASRAQDIPHEELERLVNEVCSEVRHGS